MFFPVLIVLVCLIIAWAIIREIPSTAPIPKWAWYAIVGIIAIVFLLRFAGIAKF